MATYTPNYGLHQWVPEDNFLRTDFNEDFEKLDTGLNTAQSVADQALTTANGKARMVSGYYIGDGEERRTITLDFTPEAVCLEDREGERRSQAVCGGLAVEGMLACYDMMSGGIQIIENGFIVRSNVYALTNRVNHTYNYAAFACI